MRFGIGRKSDNACALVLKGVRMRIDVGGMTAHVHWTTRPICIIESQISYHAIDIRKQVPGMHQCIPHNNGGTCNLMGTQPV